MRFIFYIAHNVYGYVRISPTYNLKPQKPTWMGIEQGEEANG